MIRGREPRQLGHNPVGAWIIVALICDVLLVGFTGWLYSTDRYWGVEWVGNLHDTLAPALPVMLWQPRNPHIAHHY